MIAATWLLLVGCVSERALTSADPAAQIAAVDRMPSWQARRWTPQLEKWAVLSAEGRPHLSNAALRALLRADSDRAMAAFRPHAERAWNDGAVGALIAVPGARSCGLLAALLAAGRVRDRAQVRTHLGAACPR